MSDLSLCLVDHFLVKWAGIIQTALYIVEVETKPLYNQTEWLMISGENGALV
jgi:hypothetical protein